MKSLASGFSRLLARSVSIATLGGLLTAWLPVGPGFAETPAIETQTTDPALERLWNQSLDDPAPQVRVAPVAPASPPQNQPVPVKAPLEPEKKQKPVTLTPQVKPEATQLSKPALENRPVVQNEPIKTDEKPAPRQTNPDKPEKRKKKQKAPELKQEAKPLETAPKTQPESEKIAEPGKNKKPEVEHKSTSVEPVQAPTAFSDQPQKQTKSEKENQPEAFPKEAPKEKPAKPTQAKLKKTKPQKPKKVRPPKQKKSKTLWEPVIETNALPKPLPAMPLDLAPEETPANQTPQKAKPPRREKKQKPSRPVQASPQASKANNKPVRKQAPEALPDLKLETPPASAQTNLETDHAKQKRKPEKPHKEGKEPKKNRQSKKPVLKEQKTKPLFILPRAEIEMPKPDPASKPAEAKQPKRKRDLSKGQAPVVAPKTTVEAESKTQLRQPETPATEKPAGPLTAAPAIPETKTKKTDQKEKKRAKKQKDKAKKPQMNDSASENAAATEDKKTKTTNKDQKEEVRPAVTPVVSPTEAEKKPLPDSHLEAQPEMRLDTNSSPESAPKQEPVEAQPSVTLSEKTDAPVEKAEPEALPAVVQNESDQLVTAHKLAGEYVALLTQWQQSRHKESMEPILNKGQEAAVAILKIADTLNEEEFTALGKQMPGYLMIRNDILVVGPEPTYFVTLATQKGKPADIAFFTLMSRTLNGYWPSTMEQLEDLSGCSRFGTGELTDLYGGWTNFKRQYPNAYKRALADPNLLLANDIEDQLLNSASACEGPESVISELEKFVTAYPRSPLTTRLKKRLGDLRQNKADMSFNQGVKHQLKQP